MRYEGVVLPTGKQVVRGPQLILEHFEHVAPHPGIGIGWGTRDRAENTALAILLEHVGRHPGGIGLRLRQSMLPALCADFADHFLFGMAANQGWTIDEEDVDLFLRTWAMLNVSSLKVGS